MTLRGDCSTLSGRKKRPEHGAEPRCLRRRACSKRDRHRLLPAPLPPVRENAFDPLRLLDARDTQEPPAAARALLDVDAEHAFEAPRPVQRRVLRQRPFGCSAARLRASSRRRDGRAQRRVGSEEQWVQRALAAPGAADKIRLYAEYLQKMERALAWMPAALRDEMRTNGAKSWPDIATLLELR
jgi:hypothetical protein